MDKLSSLPNVDTNLIVPHNAVKSKPLENIYTIKICIYD